MYVDSPTVWHEPGEGPDPDNPQYVPTTWPGARLPHVWLDHPVIKNNLVAERNHAITYDRTALHDRLGSGYTLLRLGGTRVETRNLEQSLRATGAPLEILDIADESAREIYGYDLLLVRPDLHIVWRGNQIPHDAAGIAAIATGRIAASDSAANRKASG
jgi:hypothetical protein